MSSRSIVAGPTRRQWLLLICLFVLSLPAVTPRIYSSDEIQYFAYLRSLWFDRDLSFQNEYEYFYDRGIARSEGFHDTFLERTTATGRRINFATIGCAILWAPFYGVGDVVARAKGAPADGFSQPYVAAVAYGSAFYGLAAIALAILSARRLGLNGFYPALAVWLGTPLLFYMYVAPPFSHACSAFGVSLFTYAWLRIRDTWSARGLIALGAAAALMTMIREQDAFFAFGPALDIGLGALGAGDPQGARPKAQRLVAAAAAFVVAFLPQAAAYLVLNGHLGPHASVGHKMNWTAPHALQVLFSPEHGFLVWTPLAGIAIFGLFMPITSAHLVRWMRPDLVDSRRHTQVWICLLVMILFQVYVGGSVESWTVAGAFGQRRFVALTPILILGMALLWNAAAATPRTRVARGAVTVLAVYWNLALIAEFATNLMDRQRMDPRQNAYDAFVTLPAQAPSLAYRYLFNRGSFYKQ